MQTNDNNLDRDLLIALANLPFMNAARTKRLLELYVPVSSISDAAPAQIAALLGIDESDARLVRSPLQTPQIRRLVESQRDLAVTLKDAAYPRLLREIHDPPATLFHEGDLTLLELPCIAVVGSRRASPYGRNAARAIARQLARSGVVVVSGLARGIDAAAHEEALAHGRTIAVLGTGIDVTYPREHRRLRDRIAAAGLLLTEFPPGRAPVAANFPVRNRIISGLSLGVVVVEASTRSGSLITARMASEQGREVFAVPGSIFAGGSEGCHRLIQSGAKLLHSLDDLFEELTGIAQAASIPNERRLGADAATAADHCAADEPLHIDALETKLRWERGRLAAALLEAELAGAVQALPGMRYVRLV